MAQTFFVHDGVKAFARLDAIVTVVDAHHIAAHLDDVKAPGVENESVEQVRAAREGVGRARQPAPALPNPGVNACLTPHADTRCYFTQIAFADVMLLNKTDLLENPAAMDTLIGRIRAINKYASRRRLGARWLCWYIGHWHRRALVYVVRAGLRPSFQP